MTMIRIILTAVAIVLIPSTAGSHHPVAAAALPIAKVLGLGGAGGGATAGAALAGGIVGGIGAAVIIRGVTQKRCNARDDTYVDGRHDFYPKYNRWRDPCDPRTMATKAIKLWPQGK